MEAKHQWKGWIFLAPALILMAVFTFYPFFKTIGITFLNGYNPLKATNQTFEFGIQNFIDAFNYPKFTSCLYNTIIVTIVTVPISTMLALLISVALNSIRPLQKILQTISEASSSINISQDEFYYIMTKKPEDAFKINMATKKASK